MYCPLQVLRETTKYDYSPNTDTTITQYPCTEEKCARYSKKYSSCADLLQAEAMQSLVEIFDTGTVSIREAILNA